MKITRLRVHHIAPRYSVLVLETDDEAIFGLGEACLEGRARVVEAAIRDFEPLLLGRDPRLIERLWLEMYRNTFYPSGPILASAISAVDQALWDISGKIHGVPVHELLGGRVRDRVRMYRHVNVGDHQAGEVERDQDHIDMLVQVARTAVAEGFTMIKTALPGPARGLESAGFVDFQARRFAALREAVGPGVDVAIDFHGRVCPALAKVLIKALEPYSPLFVEEPCLPENVSAMAAIARSTAVPIATGERLFTRWGFREVLEQGAAAVLQPDLAHCGGISEGRKIAAMGEAYYTQFAPHNPLGPVNLAASIPLGAHRAELPLPGAAPRRRRHPAASLRDRGRLHRGADRTRVGD
ncbi:MAG: Gluconate dehydratase [uncultured Friedmanniella sp.]|uniref:Gluconate dehydratase n=1 Tax=uncultured Friedmanniella sp. TaxID=335381 RepID=A0A6J4LH76_9ACTN|nr:galactonate dehydratase [uncultured Friedmanniella sp.]CAA9331564.1 MAG: Gluconate dehydratase [uncultured Friedmanniella sp.]